MRVQGGGQLRQNMHEGESDGLYVERMISNSVMQEIEHLDEAEWGEDAACEYNEIVCSRSPGSPRRSKRAPKQVTEAVKIAGLVEGGHAE
jgi:hypothetical protein